MKLIESLNLLRKDLIGLGLMVIFIVAFFNIEELKNDPAMESLPNTVVNLNTIFLSILLEAFPFILLGVIASGLIQAFVSEQTIQRFMPKKGYQALVPATLLAALFPICECAIIPVVRRLIKKGMPLHIGVVFLIAAPILNPVVFLSTFYAFRTNLTVVYARIGLAFIIAVVVGAIIYYFYKNSDQLKWQKEELVGSQPNPNAAPVKLNKWKQTLYHTTDEFFDTGKYLRQVLFKHFLKEISLTCDWI
jgi:uncharacterized membrane protein YraQ (UPF0718 family)